MENKNNISYQRRCAVNRAWMKERQQVMNSYGSRDWSQNEQREILATGKCHGYEGQHMLSVKEHPEYAGNEKNIQLLTHEEHFKAHGGNWKNDAQGRYNLKTGKVEPLKSGIQETRYKKLSDPLSERSKKLACSRFQKQKTTNSNKNAHESNKSNVHQQKYLPVNKSVKDSKLMYSEKQQFFSKKVSGNNVQKSAGKTAGHHAKTNGSGQSQR